ncbi:hypothetical protein O3G_MSEX009931 [Manduca sexta]|uniref:Uncharacterized protein n=1 Tax=Manduca sexta TaxID=7130 RepID=A0A922CSH6_MANSE|nr:hypothetical protein O3G_MSEX009931 [Manduca sexta]
MCRAPRRSLLLSSVVQPSAAPSGPRHSPGARGPQRRRADRRAPTRLPDYSDTAVHHRIQFE